MTNGEKFKEIFGVSQVDEGEPYAYVWLPNHTAIEFSIDWWNAPYKAESKNKCKKCEYYCNPDYERCHKCKAESEEP